MASKGLTKQERRATLDAFVLTNSDVLTTADKLPPITERLKHHIAKEEELIEFHGRRLREAQQRRLAYLDELKKHGG